MSWFFLVNKQKDKSNCIAGVFPIYKFKLVFLLSEQQTMFALLIFLFCLLSCKMLSIIRHFVSTTIANSSDRMWFASLQKILEFLWNVCFQDSFFWHWSQHSWKIFISYHFVCRKRRLKRVQCVSQSILQRYETHIFVPIFLHLPLPCRQTNVLKCWLKSTWASIWLSFLEDNET